MPVNPPQTIELDCAPFSGARPGDLLPGVLKDTGLEVREPVGKFFGNWIWNYNDVSRDVWEAALPLLRERITNLYHDGRIRYGSW